MTTDYKHRTSRKGTRQKNRIPIWRWLLAAVLLGLFVAVLVFLGNPEPPAPVAIAIKKPIRVPKQETVTKEVKKPGKPSPEKPRFEFYTLLPEQEVEIPETEIKMRKSEEKQGKAKPGNYVLQVGSFKNYKDADRLKAELAMLGIQSKIETARIDKTTWNRVKIGPFTSMIHVDTARKKLRLQQIDAIVISAK